MSRKERLAALQDATHEYVDAEKTRIENEVSVLQEVLDGRNAGKGIQAQNTSTVAAVAQSDLATYLQGA
jgi:hypothetical protein